MDSQEMLIQAVSEAVDETIASNIVPDDELQRLIDNVTSAFWTMYHERTAEQDS